MIIWFLLTLAITQIVAGQDPRGSQQPQIIRTPPVVIPCIDCLETTGMNLASLFRPSACGCGGDPGTCPPSVPLEPGVETAGEADCCCCSADNNQSNDGGPSFSVGMLAPLASVLTRIMSGIGNNGDQAVTIDFDGQTCSSNPSEEYPPGGPQCNIPPYDNVVNNQTICNMPSSPISSPVPLGLPSPVIYNARPPQRASESKVAENKQTFGACQCYRKSRKGVSDIEEDSLYAFAENSPEKKCLCNPSINQETSFNRGFTNNRYLPEVSLNKEQVQMFRNNIHQQSGPKDNNLIQTPVPTGNPEFDYISRLSALYSSQKNNQNIQNSNHEQNIMPCQCCC